MLPVFRFMVSVRLLVLDHEDSNSDEKADHQQYGNNTSNNNSIHIHFNSPSSDLPNCLQTTTPVPVGH